MVSLVHLPEHALQLVFNNINQHQAIALAPLHSKLYFTTKRKLYYYIYVYDIKEDEFLAYKLGPLSVNCALPNFRFPKHINNESTNNCTIISLKTLENYLDQMDANETISYLLMFHEPVELFERILDHFKTIKYFIASRFDVGRLDSRCSHCLRHKCHVFDPISNKTVFRERCQIIGDTGLYTYDSSMVVCWVCGPFWRSTLHPDYGQVDLTLFLKVKRMHVVIQGENESLFKIADMVNTSILSELFLTGSTYLDTFFNSHFQMDNDFPSLTVLGLNQEVISPWEENKDKRVITQLSHQSLQHVIIGTHFVTEQVATEVCQLCLQFPNASINWSCLRCSRNTPVFIEQMFRFSHVVPKGFVGVLWSFKSSEYMEPIQLKYLVGVLGNEQTVELVKYYSDAELIQLMTITRCRNSLYFY